MADFCLDCWNEIFDMNETERDVVISKGYTLCEGCAEFKQVIVGTRKFPVLYDIHKKLFFKKK